MRTLCVPESSKPPSANEGEAARDIGTRITAWRKKRLKALREIPDRLPDKPISHLFPSTWVSGLPQSCSHCSKDIGSRAARLRLYGNPFHYTLNWSTLTFVHANVNFKQLSLCDLRVKVEEDYAISPCTCEEAILEYVYFSTRVDFATVFPDASRLDIIQHPKAESTGQESLVLLKASDKLRHLDVSCGFDYSVQFHDDNLKTGSGILNSANLQTFRLHVREQDDYEHDPDARPFVTVIPGYNMLNLVELEIKVEKEPNWQFGLLASCFRLQKSAFCPRLRTLPKLQASFYEDEDGLHLKKAFESVAVDVLVEAFNQLRARGIHPRTDEIEGTIWEYARSERP